MENVKDEITGNAASVASVDMKLEVVVIPVSDVGRAEEFYTRLGWRQDVTPPGSGVFQFTPPGSACSIQFGKNLTSASPGSVQRTYFAASIGSNPARENRPRPILHLHLHQLAAHTPLRPRVGREVPGARADGNQH